MEPEPVAKAGQQPAAKEHESGDKKGKGGGDKKGKGGDQNAPRKEKEEEKPPKVYYLQSLLTGPIAARICDALKTAEPPLTLAPADVEGYLQPPSRRNAGDLCLVTYPFARRLKQQPQPLAKFLVDKVRGRAQRVVSILAHPRPSAPRHGAVVHVRLRRRLRQRHDRRSARGQDASSRPGAGAGQAHVQQRRGTGAAAFKCLVGAAARRRQRPQGKVVCIDFSSPNIAKHLALHRTVSPQLRRRRADSRLQIFAPR